MHLWEMTQCAVMMKQWSQGSHALAAKCSCWKNANETFDFQKKVAFFFIDCCSTISGV